MPLVHLDGVPASIQASPAGAIRDGQGVGVLLSAVAADDVDDADLVDGEDAAVGVPAVLASLVKGSAEAEEEGVDEQPEDEADDQRDHEDAPHQRVPLAACPARIPASTAVMYVAASTTWLGRKSRS